MYGLEIHVMTLGSIGWLHGIRDIQNSQISYVVTYRSCFYVWAGIHTPLRFIILSSKHINDIHIGPYVEVYDIAKYISFQIKYLKDT